MKNLLSLFATLLLATSLSAKEIVLSTVTSDIDSDIIKIVVDVDQHNELISLYSDTYKNNIFYQRRAYKFDDIAGGFVIYHASNRDVVTLSSDDFATYAGGRITMTYLYSGLSNEYRSTRFDIVQDENTWYITDTNNRAITSFYFKAKKIWGKLVGIKTIDYRY